MSAKHTLGILGYAIFRDGQQTGIERSLTVAQQWVDAEIVPLCAASERDDLLNALKNLLEFVEEAAEDKASGFNWVAINDDEGSAARSAIAKATGGAA